MRDIIVISNSLKLPPNPFVRDILNYFPYKPDNDIIYFIHTAELAAQLFSDFDFTNNNIKDNVIWYENNELDTYISDYLYGLDDKIEFLSSLEAVYSDQIVALSIDDRNYIKADNKLLCADLSILEKIGENTNSYNNWFNNSDIKVLLKECGYLHKNQQIDDFISYINKITGKPYLLIHFIEDLRNKRPRVYYNIGEDNPYYNMIRVEEYFNKQLYYNIDTDKAFNYNMKFGKLPASYNHNALYTTTGRMYCTSKEYDIFQNLSKEKRDILYAPKGYVLIEVDFKSFEFDILCQLINEPIHEDPHTETYNTLIGIDFKDSRDIGKNINYSYVYGMRPSRLADTIIEKMGLKSSFKSEFLEKLQSWELNEKVVEFEKELERGLSGNILTNYFGRNIILNKSYAILNNYLQSTASDILYKKIIDIVPLLGNDNKILVQNHDSILLLLKENDIADTSLFEDILSIMREPISDLEFRVDYKYGYDWKNME